MPRIAKKTKKQINNEKHMGHELSREQQKTGFKSQMAHKLRNAAIRCSEAGERLPSKKVCPALAMAGRERPAEAGKQTADGGEAE